MFRLCKRLTHGAEQFLGNATDVAEDVQSSLDEFDDVDEAAASMSYDPDPFAAVIDSIADEGG